jgi:uncharacterized protein with NRDE domain
MCLIALARGCSPRFPLVVAANRDEWIDRPAAPLDAWPDTAGPIVGGRDLRGGGGWLALTPGGRAAMLTNVRQPLPARPDAPSRGGIVAGWLASTLDPADFASAHLVGTAHAPYNLIAIDVGRDEAAWIADGGRQVRWLGRGLWGLSNAQLDTPWPKVERLKRALGAAVESAPTAEHLVDALLWALADRWTPPDEALPATGVALEWERWLSPAFIRTPDGRYGTRCSTVLVWERAGAHGARLHVVERSHAPDPGERRLQLDPWPAARH